MALKRVVIAGMIGNGLEWYDFALYGHFAVIIARLFFPSDNAFISLISAFGAFAAGFAMRPLGAILFGYIGDKYGRKVSLATSILLMAIPTACIGLLPTYAQIGIWAPVLLTVIRLLQGLSLGGEFSGSITFVIEHSKSHHRGLVGSTTIISLVGGMLLGSFVATIFAESLSPAAFEAWGWRVPFLLGIVIGLVGFYIRHHTHESPHYAEAKEQGALSKTPLRDTLFHHKWELAQAVGIYLTVTVPFYVFSVFSISYLTKIVNRPMEEALLINTIGMFALLVVVPLGAWVSDKIGRKLTLFISALALLFFIYPITYVTANAGFAETMAATILFAFILGIYLGPIPAVLAELFPTKVRYTGLAISYNICAALFGGTAPMVATWLIKTTGMNTVVAFYLIVCAIISLIALYYFRDRYKEAL